MGTHFAFVFSFKTKIMVYKLHTFFPQDCSPAKLCVAIFLGFKLPSTSTSISICTCMWPLCFVYRPYTF